MSRGPISWGILGAALNPSMGWLQQTSPRATDDLHELWRRMAFSILISNTDDHLRNHGFLHSGGSSWTLSPAFDLNPNPAPGPKHLSTALDGSATTASIEILMSVASLFRLRERDAVSVLEEVLVATRRWRAAAVKRDIPQAKIRAMSGAFEHAETEVAQGIVGG